MVDRREFIKTGAAIGAGMLLGVHGRAAWAYSQSPRLAKFTHPLRGVGGNGIPLATSDGTRLWKTAAGTTTATHYSIDIAQYTDQLHPDLRSTHLWGFGQRGNFKHLGGIIAAKRGAPVQVTFRNRLPAQHILPVDTTIPGAELAPNRTSVHLHGGLVPWVSDGGPHTWFDPNGGFGESAGTNGTIFKSINPRLKAGEAEYYYPNQQSARMLWYHDHAMGITRLNAYAGIASGYVIYDDYELELVAAANLPGPLDPRTVYLIFQDKIFVDSDAQMSVKDPTWKSLMPNSRSGDLWYAHEYDPLRWDVSGGTPPPVSCIPEFFGDTILTNGTVYPFLEVEPRQYRLRVLNACNARFLNPRLVYAKGSKFPNSTEPGTMPGPGLVQIGTEGGFLPQPTPVSGPGLPLLVVAPGERADLIVDFTGVTPGSTLILYNDAPAPYPMAAPGTAFSAQPPGYGPDTRTLLQVRVKARKGAANPAIQLPGSLTPTDPFLIAQVPGVPTDPPAGTPVRRLTLNEQFDGFGRLIQMLGTDADVPAGSGTFGRAYDDTATENINAGSTEVWEILNLTGDTHPMHFHLVNVQVLSRQAFDDVNYAGGEPTYLDAPFAPDDNELGWKETVRMNPGEVTRVLMKFDLPVVPFTVPDKPAHRRSRVRMALPHPRARGARHDAAADREVRKM